MPSGAPISSICAPLLVPMIPIRAQRIRPRTLVAMLLLNPYGDCSGTPAPRPWMAIAKLQVLFTLMDPAHADGRERVLLGSAIADFESFGEAWIGPAAD